MPPKKKVNEPHVKLYQADCPTCGRHYEGNFPMWVRIGDFDCICGAKVPAPHTQGGMYDYRFED
jgi:hypothetical protein